MAASPACRAPTVTTAACCGSTLRPTTVCSAITALDAATSGSTARCGMEPWPPTPSITTSSRSWEAISGPARKHRWPVSMPGMLCMPNSASQGKRSSRPSASMASAPPWPSSAGWKIRFRVPSKRRVAAR
ncbi:hypothetical protein D3C84_797720 [compost metagenome]